MRLERQVAVRHAVGTSADRRYEARVVAKVACCRLLTVVLLAPLVLITVAMFGPRTSCHRVTRVDTASMLVRKYAYEAFPQWAQIHHEEACPNTVDELSVFVDGDPRDPWGTELELRCGAGIRGAYVRSAGPDRTFDTADDITSND